MSIRILVVDDNPDILANVRDFLSMKDGWAPETASTGLEALERIDRSTFDLVILDVGLPVTDGMTLTRRLRASGFTAPILMLTARDTIDDRVEGLTSGADDYLIKPFSLRELAARVEALLRRSGANPAGRLTAGPLSLDLKTLRVEREGRDIKLNPTCLQLLRELMQQSPGIVASSRAVDSRRSSGRASRPPPTACARTSIFCARRSTSRSTVRSSTRIPASAGTLPIFPTPFPEAPPCPSAIRLRAALPSASC